MQKQVYKIDSNGFINEILIKNFDKDGKCTEELENNIIIVDPPQGLYKPKWTGTEWVETMTEQEYIASLNNTVSEPTTEDRLKSLEDAMISLTLGGM